VTDSEREVCNRKTTELVRTTTQQPRTCGAIGCIVLTADQKVKKFFFLNRFMVEKCKIRTCGEEIVRGGWGVCNGKQQN
jgi:hypothetical protein